MSVRRIEWPADLVLLGLRALGLEYRVTPEGRWGWVASCPCCQQGGALRLLELLNPADRYDEGGAIRIAASCSCSTLRVRDALFAAGGRVLGAR